MPLRHDYLGNPVTVGGDAELAALDDFIRAFLAYEARAAEVVAAADAHPGNALLNAYAGILWMLLEAAEAPGRAQTYLDRAERAAPDAAAREVAMVELLRAWIADDVPKALRICDAVLAQHPRDLLAAAFANYHRFNRGDFAGMLRTMGRVRADDVAEAHSMAAFAYEQCHLLDEAEAAARRALELRAGDPWAQHAFAHVMLTQGRIDEGAVFLEGRRDGWTGLNSSCSPISGGIWRCSTSARAAKPRRWPPMTTMSGAWPRTIPKTRSARCPCWPGWSWPGST